MAEGGVEALVSAGHTGAFVAASQDQAADAAVRPARHSQSISDRDRPFPASRCGANVDCEPGHLFQFGIMGSVYSREVLDERTRESA